VIYKDEKSKLYYLRYYVDEPAGSTDGEVEGAVTLDPEAPFDPTVKHQILHRDEQGRRYAVVATTRPETIMGDTAMCINPKDPKNTWLKGKNVSVQLVGRSIPVIEDRYVDIEFGTGCLKVTPAHDTNDYMLGKTHNLETIDIFNADATLSEAAGLYVGMDRMDVRKQIVIDLKEAALMEKVENYENKVGYSERNSDTAVEPRLCMQWFLKMQHFADIALPPVMNDELKFYPPKYKTTYNNWLENIQDWCISRQLWWGHRIPAYFLPGAEEKFVVAETPEKALELAKAIPGYENITADQLRQDDDALDTWFSSWLWPLSLFKHYSDAENEEIKYYYPTSDLVTGPDIIFFWVARMIMAGYEYRNEMPFKNVYFTGIVRDKLGRKMSKSLGNSPDPLDLIARYGADAVRMGMMLSAPAGNDILFDEALCEQGRNFNNKIWNAFRLVKGWSIDNAAHQPESAKIAVEWFNAMLDKASAEIADLMGKYRLSEALMAVYKLFWDDFCAWYLEMVKPAYGAGIDKATYDATSSFFDSLLRLLHPFMPFITEELWQNLEERKDGDTIMFEKIPSGNGSENPVIAQFEDASQIVMNVRNIRQTKGISPKEPLEIFAQLPYDSSMDAVVKKLANISSITTVDAFDSKAQGVNFMIRTNNFFVPLNEHINVDEEVAKMKAEIEYYEKFLKQVNGKLSNEKFVNNAPENVVAIERKKQADATAKIENLQNSIAALLNK
ncbi:MAG: valine--tRNA ligase, partial [Bacteroidales bacterium]|nr:valine--tRNA ligase [Bacteroidales bacterium]